MPSIVVPFLLIWFLVKHIHEVDEEEEDGLMHAANWEENHRPEQQKKIRIRRETQQSNDNNNHGLAVCIWNVCGNF